MSVVAGRYNSVITAPPSRSTPLLYHLLDATRTRVAFRLRRSRAAAARLAAHARQRALRASRRGGRAAESVRGGLVQRRERAMYRLSRWGAAVSRASRRATHLVSYRVPGEAAACPACGSARLVDLAPLRVTRAAAGRRVGFITGCRACGLLFVNPLPTDAELRAFYSPEGVWGQEREAEAPRQEKAPRTTYVRELLKPVEQWLDPARPPADGAVLDFGCGDGKLLDAFQALGWRTYGIDPANKRAFARHRELAAIPAEPTFDLALLNHVLEHVAAPLDLLRALHRALKPGGLVFVSVPRLDTMPRHRDFRYCVNPRTHIVAYSRDCLATLFASAGFEPIDLSPPADQPATEWFALRRLRMVGRKTDAPVRPPSPEPLRAAMRALDGYHAGSTNHRSWSERFLSVRMQAALADLRRGGRPA